jgi:serine/threonine protein phosphatase PrpC
MLCANCGAELRSNARFCNRCGAQVAGSADQSGDVGAPRPGAPAAAASAMPRPPTLAAPSTRPNAGAGDQPNRASLPRANITAQLDPRDFPGAVTAAPQPPANAAPMSAGDLLPSDPSLLAAGAAPRPDDQLPWPLPPGLILDGRYRVESLSSASEVENSYVVTDLRGYEQCWACGQVYGASAATERFCRECGADMLGRQLVLRERAIAPDEPASIPTEGGAGESVRTFVQSGRAYRVEPKVTPRAAFPLGARLIAGAASDLGKTRSGELNEDSALVLVLDRLHESHSLPVGLFAVADGLGGHANGPRASRLVINVLAHTIVRNITMPVLGSPAETPLDEDQLSNLLTEAVRAANGSLCAANKEAGLDAGSTLVAALIYGETAYIANVGDSRAYVCDESGLRRITSDHSLVQQLVAGGLIHPDDVYTHPQRNQIFRSLGDDPDIPVDLFVQQLRPGMRFLLCSDGLWEMVRDPDLETLLHADTDPQSTCDALMTAANDGGGEDNITAVVVEAR